MDEYVILNPTEVFRRHDEQIISADKTPGDWAIYENWLAHGGVPGMEQTYDHHNV